MNNVLNVLVSRLYMAERRIPELEETSIEIFKRKKNKKEVTDYPKPVKQIQKV